VLLCVPAKGAYAVTGLNAQTPKCAGELADAFAECAEINAVEAVSVECGDFTFAVNLHTMFKDGRNG
jgi:hypothetical protein